MRSHDIHIWYQFVTVKGPNRNDDKRCDGKSRDVAERMKGFGSAEREKRSRSWPLRPINSSKYRRKKNSVVMERPGKNAAARAKKINGKREETNGRAPIRGLSKKPQSSVQRGERRETRSDGGRLREEKKNNKKENASSNSSRQAEGGTEEKKRGRCDRSVRVQVMRRTSRCIFLSFSLSLPPSPSSSLTLLSLAHPPLHPSLSLLFSLSPSLSLSLSLSFSLSCCGDSVLQVVRPPIGGCARRCAWVGEAWYPPPIGYRILPTPEVGTRRRKEDRNEGGRS